ncbi:hypothetical protein GPJ56_010169 [Histomonas meleagridis]|uniref:uncharacterized protein n=1 Tax=Histomonas meleagridis TaxID=135588 RepID=UPI00355A94F0|nr:hypothetical protein GPJ56_010169 [Histomonas meleagridis]KAH0804705.1 hypothetical protein GO595_002399 [Histomonas meleagridis]
MNGRIDSVQILLDGGGSKSAINADAMTPTDVAHGTYARNIQEALDGKLQNIMYLCEPDPYPQKKPQPQQEPPKPQQDSGCVVQ